MPTSLLGLAVYLERPVRDIASHYISLLYSTSASNGYITKLMLVTRKKVILRDLSWHWVFLCRFILYFWLKLNEWIFIKNSLT